MSGPQGYDPSQPWQPPQPEQGQPVGDQPTMQTPSWQQPTAEPTIQTSGWQQPGGGQQPTQMAGWQQSGGEQPAPQQSGWDAPAYTPTQYQQQPPSYPSAPQQYSYPSTDQYGAQATQYGQPTGYGQQAQYGQQPAGYGQYPQTGQFGFPPAAGQTGQPGPGDKKSRAVIFSVIGALAAIVVAAVLVVGFWVPGLFVTTKLDITKAQAGVQQILGDQTTGYGAKNVKDVKCNDGKDPEVKKGETFKCEVSIDGTKSQVTVTFLDNKEGKYEVGRPTPK